MKEQPADASRHEPQGKHLRVQYFVLAVIPSLLLASLLMPTEFGLYNYLETWGSIFLCACMLAMLSIRKKRKSILAIATVLMLIAPFLTIALLSIAHDYFKMQLR